VNPLLSVLMLAAYTVCLVATLREDATGRDALRQYVDQGARRERRSVGDEPGQLTGG
jgi:hypothetical protein